MIREELSGGGDSVLCVDLDAVWPDGLAVEYAVQSADGSDLTDAAGFSHRVKALATTAPLHDLEARKTSVQAGDWSVYQMAELALHAIDLVTIAMDFDTGARPDQVVAALTDRVKTQAPARDDAEHARVARWVLENLLNVGSVDRGFETVYGETARGAYRLRTFNFKLIEETLGADGEVCLRASNEAVNVLVGALDVDLEAAHVAADVRLDVLIRRGRLSEAQNAAQNARYRTIGYGEHLRRQLEATTRDVRNVDWVIAMPQFIQEALDHVVGRYRAENAILVNITNVRDTADTPARKLQAARLVQVVRDCLRRNDQLSSALQRAGRTFRAEQDRQSFSATPALVSLDLYAQLLVPTLSLTVSRAVGPLATYFITSSGLVVPPALRLADLFDALITPPTGRDLLGDVVEDPDLSEEEEPPRFSDEAYAHMNDLLDLDPEAPQRLSGLLGAARALQAGDPEADDLPLLVVIRVLALAAQEIGAARRHQNPSVLIAVDDGTDLDEPDFAGADPLVARATLMDRAPVSDANGTSDGMQGGVNGKEAALSARPLQDPANQRVSASGGR